MSDRDETESAQIIHDLRIITGQLRRELQEVINRETRYLNQMDAHTEALRNALQTLIEAVTAGKASVSVPAALQQANAALGAYDVAVHTQAPKYLA